MFTGIVEEVGKVHAITPSGMSVEALSVLEDAKSGDSISVNGACLTVTSISRGQFSVDIVPETWRRTNLGDLHRGDLVNLERSLAANGRMGGHFVQGHVDGTGRVSAIEPDGDAIMVRFQAPPELARYIVAKGFITVDGISLTVVESAIDAFSVTLIPYTREHTNFQTKGIGDAVNLEVDILAKYVERFLDRETTQRRETNQGPEATQALQAADWRR